MASINRRKFVLHSAHTTLGVSAGLAALHAADLTGAFLWADEPVQKRLAVCLVSGSPLYKSDESLAAFAKHIGRQPIDARLLTARGDDDLPGLEQLDACQTAVFFTRRSKIAGEPLDRVKRYCESGRGIIGVRTASHGFQNWLDMDKQVFGGDYQGHYGKEPVTLDVTPAGKRPPILDGFVPFVSKGSLYKNPKIADDATVLLEGDNGKGRHPVAWVRQYGKSRVFYTSLGSPEDFAEPAFLRLLVNAILWTAGRT